MVYLPKIQSNLLTVANFTHRKSESCSVANCTTTGFHKEDHNLCGSVGSPEKAKTEKICDTDEDVHKQSVKYPENETGNKNLTLHSLKKRASMKERYNSFRADRRVLSTVEDSGKDKVLDETKSEKSGINLPAVNQKGKQFLDMDCKRNSVAKDDSLSNDS